MAQAGRRVLYVNRVGFLGGVERVLVTLADGIEAHGYAPLVACPGGGDLEAALRGRAIPVEPWDFERMRITANPLALAGYPLAWRRAAARVEAVARAHRVDLIHVHHPVGCLYALPAARRLGLPVVLHVHDGLPVRPLYAMALRVAARQASRLICVSGVAVELLKACGVGTGKATTIHNGVDRGFLGEVPEPRPEVSGPGPHIGVFGVIEPRKGHDIFLEAASRLSKRHPTARFWVVGPVALADKAGFATRLEAMAQASELAGRVTFTGFQGDVARWMAAMDVVALPSVEHESLGMVLVEAMALGRPVVASRIGGPMEVITDGETGRLVPPRDPQALAEAIEDLLATDRTALGARAAADARARFAPEIFCQRVAHVYEDALRSHGSR